MANQIDMTDHLPKDRGWAWMVLIGTTSIMIIFDGVFRSSGLFILQYQERFGSSTSETTLVVTFFMVVNSVTGVFVMTVGMKYMSVRTSVCVGGLLTSAAYAIGAFIEHIEVLIVFIGAMAGVGAIMALLPMLSAIGMYFEQRRSLANSVTAAGTSIGALVFGPLYTMLFDHYGYSGTMLIASGILLNIVAAGCLIRPPEFYSRSKAETLRETCMQEQPQFKPKEITTPTLTSEDSNTDQFESYIITRIDKAQREVTEILLAKSTENISTPQSTHGLTSNTPTAASSKDTDLQSSLLTQSITIECSRSEISDRARTNIWSSGSIIGSVSNADVINDEQFHNTKLSGYDTNSFCMSINFLKTIFDTDLCKNPVFMHYILFAMSAVSPCMITPMFVVPFASDIGISDQRLGIFLFVLGVMDLIGRLCVGVLLDKKIMQSTTIMAIVFLIMAVLNNLLRLVKTFEALMALAVIQGCLSGQFSAVFAVILIEYIGPSKFPSALGFVNLFMGIARGICIPITGLLRDITGAYYWPYHLLGGLLFLAAILALTLPYTHRKYGRDTNANQESCNG